MDLKNKNILITGGNGFIASNFLNYMTTKYKETNFYNYDCNYYSSSLKNNENLRNLNNYFEYNEKIQNRDFILDVLKSNSITIIIHFAAQSHVSNSFINSQQFIDDNIIGTYSLLEAIRLYNNIEKFIYISTDEVYGENISFDINDIKTENSLLDPTNPYSATKAASEMLVNSYYYSYKIPIIIVRCNNIYGKKQHIEKVIPKFITQVLNNDKITIQGNQGLNKRSFLYINDFISGLELILLKGDIKEIYNIGSEFEISILDLAKTILMNINDDINYDNYDFSNNIIYINDRNYNDKRYNISNEKIKKLGWTCNHTFDIGIKETINWYKFNRNYWNI